ncbi:PGF-CTERM sorting domain-containing protein [Natronorubrum bangense]|uniref:PGF-CTERM sorting domain-containing protein n=1 Tax=Natronorubrum bangense JCM 10635 TaxID=1227500 RepID=L9W045_9EURY|nr:PGF-CTERM sorting domain-containing protein [Natronorubrum bangense]ELY42692.1 hypothetical protein C494_20358 [Natronorubrum bangense JCM 10635]
MTFETATRETRWTVLVTAAMIVSMVALSTVAAGAAAAGVADADGDADSDLEVTVDAPNSIAATEAATFDVTVTTTDGEPATTDVVFEISGDEMQEEVVGSTDDAGAVTFTAEGIALSEGDYEWTVTASDEDRTGTLTVTDATDDGATDDAAADNDSTTAADNDTAIASESVENDTTADNDTTDADDPVENDTATADDSAENETTDADTAAENDTAADNDSETEEDEPMPGFGIGAAFVALLAGTVLAVQRRS